MACSFLIPFTYPCSALRPRFTLRLYLTRCLVREDERTNSQRLPHGDLRAAEGYAKVSSNRPTTEPPNGQTRSNPGTQSHRTRSVVGWVAEEEAHPRASASVRPRAVFLRFPSEQCAMLQRLCVVTHVFIPSLDAGFTAKRRSGRAFVLRVNPCGSSK
jgi:hypothetical protein